MQQRLMIAIAISCNPKLLIADEPTTALDVTVEAQVLELLEKLKKELGMGIILITHNLGIVARYAQRVNVMYAGKIVEQGSAEQVYGNPRHPYTRGLLSCVPRLDRAAGERRTTIPGAPPNLAHLGQGCAFMPRCSYATEQCGTAIPPLMEISDAHVSACWVRNELVEQTARAPLGLV
jgi:oligopeptide/dipeptide ABC transporter ATP-binding protein